MSLTQNLRQIDVVCSGGGQGHFHLHSHLFRFAPRPVLSSLRSSEHSAAQRRQVFIAILDSFVNIWRQRFLISPMKDTFISSEGRIGRFVFTVRVALLVALMLISTKVAVDYFDQWHDGHYSPLGPFIGIIVAVFCLLAGLMQLLKRLRDMGKPAYWTLLMLIPGVNLLVLLYAAVAPSNDAQ
jgi:uncharacterized membrane protein YhaH (DUF805 family)